MAVDLTKSNNYSEAEATAVELEELVRVLHSVATHRG